MKRKKKIQFG